MFYNLPFQIHKIEGALLYKIAPLTPNHCHWLHENHTECWELQNRNCFTATTAAVAIAAAAASGGHGEIYCLRFTV